MRSRQALDTKTHKQLSPGISGDFLGILFMCFVRFPHKTMGRNKHTQTTDWPLSQSQVDPDKNVYGAFMLTLAGNPVFLRVFRKADQDSKKAFKEPMLLTLVSMCALHFGFFGSTTTTKTKTIAE